LVRLIALLIRQRVISVYGIDFMGYSAIKTCCVIHIPILFSSGQKTAYYTKQPSKNSHKTPPKTKKKCVMLL